MSTILSGALTGLLTISLLIFVPAPCMSENPSLQRISIIVGSDAGCGSHAGSFNAMYQSRQIEVVFFYSSNPANPVEIPLTVYKDNKQVKNWRSMLCPIPGNSGVPLTGKFVGIEGHWRDKKTFQASKIYLP